MTLLKPEYLRSIRTLKRQSSKSDPAQNIQSEMTIQQIWQIQREVRMQRWLNLKRFFYLFKKLTIMEHILKIFDLGEKFFYWNIFTRLNHLYCRQDDKAVKEKSIDESQARIFRCWITWPVNNLWICNYGWCPLDFQTFIRP